MLINYDVIEHIYGPGHTIEGALRMYNGMDVSPDKLEYLVRVYSTLNSADVPHAFDSVKIPVLKAKDIGVIEEPKVDLIAEFDFSGMSAMEARQKRRELARCMKHK